MATENTGKLSEDSSNSSSRSPSSADNLTADPSFKCVVTDIEYTSRSTRLRNTSEGLGIDSSSLETTLKFKTYNIFLTDAENEAEQAASTADESQIQSPNLDPVAPTGSKPTAKKVPSKTTKWIMK